VRYLLDGLKDEDDAAWLALIGYALLHRMDDAIPNEDANARTLYHQWMLDEEFNAAMQEMGLSPFRAGQVATLTGALLGWQDWHLDTDIMARPYSARPGRLLTGLLEDEDVRQFLGVNLYQGVEWYNQEAMDALLHGLFATAVLELVTEPEEEREVARTLVQCYDVIRILTAGHALSGNRIDKLKELI
jgi:hypothetical protein